MLAALFVSSLLFSGPAETVEAPEPPTEEVELGRIAGVVKDQDTGEAVVGAVVVLQCECLEGLHEVHTNDRGVYVFNELPEGQYTIQVLEGRRNVSKITSLPAGAKLRANFTLREDHRRPQYCEGPNCERAWTGPEPRYWGGDSYGDHTNLRNGGLGLLVAGGGMAVGSILAGTVNMCGRDGAHDTDCSRDPRVHLAIGFGVAAAVLTSAGGAMLGVAKKRRKMDLGVSGDRHGASISLSGRF